MPSQWLLALTPPFVENLEQPQLVALGRLEQVAAEREFRLP
jgi:hypothetical protein